MSVTFINSLPKNSPTDQQFKQWMGVGESAPKGMKPGPFAEKIIVYSTLPGKIRTIIDSSLLNKLKEHV